MVINCFGFAQNYYSAFSFFRFQFSVFVLCVCVHQSQSFNKIIVLLNMVDPFLLSLIMVIY